MATAKKLPSGNWRIREKKTINGKQMVKSFTAPTKREAEFLGAQWLMKQEEDKTSLTVKDAILKYIDEFGSHDNLSPSTINEYNRIAKSKLKNDLADLKDEDIYKLTKQQIKQSMIQCPLSPKTIKNRYGLLQRVMHVYRSDFVWDIEYPKIRRKRRREYSNQLIFSIMKSVAGTHLELEAYLGFLSMRASEIGGLMWSDVNLDEKYMDISRSKVYSKDGFVLKDINKTYLSSRRIYLPDKVVELMKERQKNSTDEFVSHIKPNQLWTKLNKILKQSGIEKIAFHDLRHIYSSVSSSLGIDSAVRMENGGWSNEQIMNGVYRHPITEKQIEANEKMNEYVNSIVGN